MYWWCILYSDGSSNDSSSDDEVKEAFENCLTASSSPPSWSTDHTHWSSIQRPIRVPSSAGCRKRGPKYFAQMSSSSSSSPVTIERPRLDFNKMQSKRFLMVILSHDSHVTYNTYHMIVT